MRKAQKTRNKEERNARQLKLCSIVLVVYMLLIILFILVTKDKKQQHTARYSNETISRKLLIGASRR